MELHNHKGMFLNDAAAMSLKRLEDDHGVQPITDAGRTPETQQGYIDRWDKGGVYNRPPYLYEPARPKETSSHVKNGGEAVDVANWRWWRENAAEYGWVVDFDWDVVHFRYDPSKDKKKNIAANVVATMRLGKGMDYIRIAGKAGERRGGTYVVFQAKDYSYVAEFIGDAGPNNLVTITDETSIKRLQDIIAGLK